MVVRARLVIRHHGCITERLTGETTLTQVSGERGWDLFVMRAPDAKALARGLRIAESNGAKAEVLARTPGALVFKGRNEPEGVVSTIRASPCWIEWPIVYRDRLEHYTIGAPSRAAVRALVADLARFGDVRLERVREHEPEALEEGVSLGDIVSDLTPRQLAALQLAVARGYYDAPSRTSSERLAREFGVSASTMREHVRKAEALLLRRVVALLAERPAARNAAARTSGRRCGRSLTKEARGSRRCSSKSRS